MVLMDVREPSEHAGESASSGLGSPRLPALTRLMFAGITDTCGMATLLSKLPYNQRT